MPESVKISELPELTQLNRDDIFAVVDEAYTQTSKATLGQVKDMPAGGGTVDKDALVNGAVQTGKTGYTTADKYFYASGTQTSSGVYIGAEGDITPFARQLLAAGWGGTDQQQRDALRALLNESATFDRIFTGDGTSEFPAHSFTNATTTGMHAGENGLLGLAVLGQRLLTLLPDGSMLVAQPPPTNPSQVGTYEIIHMLSMGANTICAFQPGNGVVQTSVPNAYKLASFMGMPEVIRGYGHAGNSDQANVIRIDGSYTADSAGIVTSASGNLGAMATWLSVHGYNLNTLSLTSGSFYSTGDNSVGNVQFNGGVGDPLVRVSNTFARDANAFYDAMSIQTRATSLAVRYQRGTTSIQNSNADYTVRFSTHYPDTNYLVFFGSTGGGSISGVTKYVDRVEFTINSTAQAASELYIATMR